VVLVWPCASIVANAKEGNGRQKEAQHIGKVEHLMQLAARIGGPTRPPILIEDRSWVLFCVRRPPVSANITTSIAPKTSAARTLSAVRMLLIKPLVASWNVELSQ
jgi:hypothetical protein